MQAPSRLAKEYTKHRGYINASKELMKWYNEIKKTNSPTGGVEDWNKMLERGKIYIFDYDPRTKNLLSFYDKNPMILSLGKLKRMGEEGPLDIGINLNFIPADIKEDILDTIYRKNKNLIKKETSNNKNPGKQRALDKVTYQTVGRMLKNSGFEFAIRTYYKHRRKNNIVLDYADWYRTLVLSTEDTVGVKVSQIHAAYQADKNSGTDSGGLLSRGLAALKNVFN